MIGYIYPSLFNKRKTKKHIETLSVESHVIHCNIDKIRISDIMNTILINYCKVDVCGYNSETDEYWGKKFKNRFCDLHFSISILNAGSNGTTVVIKVATGSNKTVDLLLGNIMDVIKLYEENE